MSGNSFLNSFSTIWREGYYEGDPLDPMAPSSYGLFGYISSLRATYLACIRPYIRPGMNVLEIGPGRGAWTKTMLQHNPAIITAIDVVDGEYAGFHDYVGRHDNVRHVAVQDFELSDVPDASVDYFFSFGVFCHLKPEMCEAYVRSLSRKMKSGANGFLMIADFDKYNACHAEPERWSALAALKGGGRRLPTLRWVIAKFAPEGLVNKPRLIKGVPASETGSWFHWGTDAAVAALRASGFSVVAPDIMVNNRDPVIHFTRD